MINPKTTLRTWVAMLAASLATVINSVRDARAQDDQYPTRLVTLVLPQPAGGAVDSVARALAPRLSERLGQQVIVESRPGANGTIAAEYVARAAPDGHTLFMAVDSQLTVNPNLYDNVKYDPFRDFVPISIIVRLYTSLLANPALKANSVSELIALARAQPGVINFASVGHGSLQHLGMEYFKSAAKIDLTHVPYKGASTALPDLFRGSVQLLLIGEQTALTYTTAGQAKTLAVTSAHRSRLTPQVPAISETIPGFELKAWFGVLAPAKTPDYIRATLLRAIQDITTNLEFRQTLDRQGFEVAGTGPGDMSEAMRSESATWARLIRDIGAKVN